MSLSNDRSPFTLRQAQGERAYANSIVTQPAPADAPPNQGVQVGYPIKVSDEFKGAVVLDVTRRSATELRALVRQLHWGYGMAM